MVSSYKLIKSSRAGAGMQRRAAERLSGELTTIIDGVEKAKKMLKIMGRKIVKGKRDSAVADMDAVVRRLVDMATRIRRAKSEIEVIQDTAQGCYTSLDEALGKVAVTGTGGRTGGTILHHLSSEPADLSTARNTFMAAPGCVPFAQPPIPDSS